jgi:hypothetical protein
MASLRQIEGIGAAVIPDIGMHDHQFVAALG